MVLEDFWPRHLRISTLHEERVFEGHLRTWRAGRGPFPVQRFGPPRYPPPLSSEPGGCSGAHIGVFSVAIKDIEANDG